MIPFGPFHPDKAGINTRVLREARGCVPAVGGFKPLQGPVAVSDALPTEVKGAATVLLSDGSNESFCGTETDLYKLSNTLTWQEITRISGGDYSVSTGERWNFEKFGDLLVAVAHNTDPQKYDLVSGTRFEALGGSPPKARYIAIVRDFLVLGGLFEDELKLHWSAINNAEGWTAGTNSSDTQEFPDGGPVRGIVGGEVGYVFQAEKVRRMTFVPGSAEIFQFDEVEGGRGLAAPHSLVRLGGEAFYYAPDGFYRFNLAGGGSQQIGTGKWARWFADNLRTGSETSILGAISPRNRAIIWAFISKENPETIPDRLLIYDWAIDEATFADVSVEAVSNWLQAGYTLDNINSFGTLDALPFSLDSPFWRGGAPLIGVFGSDHKLAHLEGQNLEAQFVTSDGARQDMRTYVRGTRPQVDSTATKVEISARERDGDAINYDTQEEMEDDGTVPAHISGHLVRARVTVPAGESWTYWKGLETESEAAGSR